MRKRAQIKTPLAESLRTPKRVESEKKSYRGTKNWWIAVALIGIFFLVLVLNSYFNIISGMAINPEGEDFSEKFYLSGPDPYYNMRIVDVTLKTGRYPFYSENDPIINYPLGRSGGRAPLMNMMAIGFSRLLTPFMSEMDAVGYSMQFISALFGALIVFPIYFIGKILFGRKEGLIAAFFVAIIPIHIGSGHGSAYALFDHDSFNLFLFFLIFLFLIKSIRESNQKRAILFAALSGISVAALTMVWVESRYIYSVIALYAVVQILMDVFNNKIDRNFIRNIVIILLTGYFISLPVIWVKGGSFTLDITLFLGLGIALLGGILVIFKKMKIPWIVSLPSIFCLGGIVAVLLYYIKYFPFLSPLKGISEILYGSGIYGTKVDLTVAEAGTYNISRSVMSYGPVLYWLAWAGLIFLIYQYFKQKDRRDYLFFVVLFFINIWLASTAGRFLNDHVPLVAILAAGMTWFVVSKIDYKQMLRNIRNAGGGFRGLKRGIKLYHVMGVIFVSVLIILPNTLLALDAAIPSAIVEDETGNFTNMKWAYFGEGFQGAFGSSSSKEEYWVDAFSWLKDQDTEIKETTKRPAFISWWDYGFYESAVGDHPTVADNFQTGIPTAANFHTAKSEKEAVAVLIVRLLEGDLKDNDGSISPDVEDILQKHVGENDTNNITNWIQNPISAPSYGAPIGEEYDEELSKELLVGEQWPINAAYHDITKALNNTLDDEGITWLYHDLQEATGYSIRYYGVEGYDKDIFNIFGFLGDKSLVLHALRSGGGGRFYNAEDDFIQVSFVGYKIDPNTRQKIPGSDSSWTANELNAMNKDELKYIAITDTSFINKEDYFKTMFYKTYIGAPPTQTQEGEYQLPQGQFPCYGMKHFVAEYISPYPYYGTRRVAVIIAKYFEGAFINGSLSANNTPLQYSQVVVFDELGIPHDNLLTDQNGNFSLLTPAGNITLQFSYTTMEDRVILKEITFNQTDNPLFSPITDREAMRLDSNYTREINITINLSTNEGFVYEDTNNNDTYDPGIDIPLQNVIIEMKDEFFPNRETKSTVTDESGYYKITDLYPSKYTISALEDGFEIHSESIIIEPGHLSYNISKPQLAAIEGKIFYDKNDNGSYDPSEEMGNVKVDIIYSLDNRLVDSMITEETGYYTFDSLVPGEYIINATLVNKTTGYYDYIFEESVEIVENETKVYNVSITLAPVAVSGFTKYDAKNIEGISIVFSPDESVENNTAELERGISDEDGLYKTELIPGYYNITVDDRGEEGIFAFTGQLNILKGEGVKTYNILMTKLSVKISGTTKYSDLNVGNITITFSPDVDIENNTAESAITVSDENGLYAIELMPGSYDVEIDEEVNETGQLVTYTFSGKLKVQTEEIYDITLMREEQS